MLPRIASDRSFSMATRWYSSAFASAEAAFPASASSAWTSSTRHCAGRRGIDGQHTVQAALGRDERDADRAAMAAAKERVVGGRWVVGCGRHGGGE